VGKDDLRIYKQDWKPREEFEVELGAENVIYTLIDTKKKQIYVGEADNLVKRLASGHNQIPQWDYYRYNILPSSLSQFRLTLERMVIRDYATLLCNTKGIDTIKISEYQLVNEKIDK